MTEPVKTILFDMDNTLFDLVGAQIAACNAVAGYLGQTDGTSLFENYFLSNTRGYESHENIRDYLVDRSLSVDDMFHDACMIYEKEKLGHIVPYDGVIPTLAEFWDEGYHLGIITDAHSRDATRRLEKAGLLSFFAGVVSFDMVMVRKPSPEPFIFALEMMRAGPKDAILLGDSPRRDIQPARNLGIRTVYARYGDRFSRVRECPEADYVIDRIDELPPIIRSLSADQK